MKQTIQSAMKPVVQKIIKSPMVKTMEKKVAHLKDKLHIRGSVMPGDLLMRVKSLKKK